MAVMMPPCRMLASASPGLHLSRHGRAYDCMPPFAIVGGGLRESPPPAARKCLRHISPLSRRAIMRKNDGRIDVTASPHLRCIRITLLL